jgi:hypothetical protein
MLYAVLCRRYVRSTYAYPFDYVLTMRMSVMLNDHSMYEHILEDDIFFGVVGMLECAFPFPFPIPLAKVPRRRPRIPNIQSKLPGISPQHLQFPSTDPYPG